MITRITTLCFAKHVIHCLNKIPNINVQLSPCEKKESSIGTCPKGEKKPISRICTTNRTANRKPYCSHDDAYRKSFFDFFEFFWCVDFVRHHFFDCSISLVHDFHKLGSFAVVDIFDESVIFLPKTHLDSLVSAQCKTSVNWTTNSNRYNNELRFFKASPASLDFRRTYA